MSVFIKGSIFAIELIVFEDDRVGMHFFMEDDEKWYPIKTGPGYNTSIAWCEDFIEVFNKAIKWRKENCQLRYGYKLKLGTKMPELDPETEKDIVRDYK